MDLCDLILNIIYNCFDSVVTVTIIFLCIDTILHLFKTYTKRKTTIIYILIIFTCILLKSIINFQPNYYLLKIIIASITILSVIKFIFKLKYQQYSIAIITVLVLFTFVELESIAFAKHFNLNVDMLYTNYLYKYLLTFITSISQFALLVLTHHLVKKHYRDYNLDLYNVTGIMPQLLVIVICLLPIILLISIAKFTPTCVIIAIASIQLCIITIVGIYNILFCVNNAKVKQTLDETLIYNSNLKQTNDDMRGYKHDISNIIQSSIGYIKCKDIAGLSEYYGKLLVEDRNITTMSYFPPELINDPAIYGVVCSKLCEAKDKKIELDINIDDDFRLINFPKIDLARSLGILLDNAVYAASCTKNGKLILKVQYDNTRKQDKITITNSVSNFNFDINRMFDKNYSTKSVPSGFGLYEVKKILKSNPQAEILPITDTQNMLFSQTLIINRKD